MPGDDRISLRDYGLGSAGQVTGVPVWKRADINSDVPHECPNCGAHLCEIEVEMSNSLLMGGRGICHYHGCPACPFASPAVVVALTERQWRDREMPV